MSLLNTEPRTLASAAIGQRYELLVSLPEGYATSGQSYPVLYVLDGWHFPLMALLQNNNIYSQRVRPVMMVTLSYGARPNVMALAFAGLLDSSRGGRVASLSMRGRVLGVKLDG